MAICKFFNQGNCRNGNNCRFEHINPGNRPQQSNRFGALGGSGGQQSQADKYNITTEVIERDLTVEVPTWILSAYGPGRDAPEQLFGGYPREQSFEELRLHYMAGKAAGNEQQALAQAHELYSNAKQQMDNAAKNSREAMRFIVEAENTHPNRNDICKQGTEGAPFGEFLVGKRPKSLVQDSSSSANPFGSNNAATSSPFGGAASQTASTFGKPSALGAKTSPFGAPAFGQPSQPAGTPAFGQPSQPAATSAFGQPSQPASAFGQPSLAATSSFGQPPQPSSAFGQPSTLGAKPSPFGTPAFGQPSQSGTQGNAFGQPSQLGAQSSAFGQPSQPAGQGSAFGQPSQLGQKVNPFASAANTGTNASPFATVGNNAAPTANPFGAPSSNQSNNQSDPFGSNSNQNQTNGTASAFGQPSQPVDNPFGKPSAPAATNPFGAPSQTASASPFGLASQPSMNGAASQQQTNGAFGQPSNANANASPFGQPSNAPAAATANPFGAPVTQKPAATSGSGPYAPGSSKQHPPIETYSSRNMAGGLSMFKGKSVIYKGDMPGIREFDGTWRRIWYPDGPPGYSKDTELPPEEYDDKSKAQWAAFAQTGTFQDELMPALPPPRECTQWDF